ncbi:DUF3054 domain-containing protein [Georgenia alba]|uniref:DUF3054 domain-containing protein n=1 Tax=Georgenia alba TaxID=2233858 RepID=A0ABW2Q7D3_9MICO
MTEDPQAPAVPPAAGRPLRWFGVDLLAVVVFTVLGMVMHGTPAGDVIVVIWPFVVGLALAWAIPAVRAMPLLIWPTGVVVWASTTIVGLALRGLTGGGVTGAFPVITALVLAVLLIGWRALPWVQRRRHDRQARVSSP